MQRSLRLALTGNPAEGLVDGNGNQAAVWDGDGIHIQLYLGSVCAGTALTVTDFVNIECEFRLTAASTELLLPTKVILAPFAAITAAGWAGGTVYSAEFILTNQEMNFPNGTTQFWCSFRGLLTSGDYYTLGAGYVLVEESHHGSSQFPPLGPFPAYYTAAEVDALLDGIRANTLYLVSETPDDEGMLSIIAGGTFFRIVPSDFQGGQAFQIGSFTYQNGFVAVGAYLFQAVAGGTGSGAGTITVVNGMGEFTTGGVNYQTIVTPGGAGSQPGTIRITAGFAQFTYLGINYQFQVTPQ